MVTRCDVLVIGAGPAGSAAARKAAETGVQVVLVERRTRIGLPVQCAEYIPAMLLTELDIKRDFIAQKIDGMRTYLPGGEVHETRAPGFIIHRDRFDQALAAAAVEAGATLMTGTSASSVDDTGQVRLKTKNQDSILMLPKVMIGADGPRSTVGGWAGLINDHLLPGVQMTLPLRQPLSHTEVYLDPQIPGGYAWLFPKGDAANVGLGLVADLAPPRSARRLLDGFIERLAAAGKVDPSPLACAAGWIPAVPVRSAVSGNMILTGDAAGHTHAITGAGIFNAVTTGKMAGEWAARAAAANDLSLLAEYDRQWQGLLGSTLRRAAERRSLMEGRWKDFDAVIKTCWVAFREYYARRT